MVVMAAAGGIVLSWDARADAPPSRVRADSLAAVPDSIPLPPRVTAYYFHTSYRCASCRKIEAYAKEAIETGFPDELRDGRLVWRVVNVEDKGNEHFVKDYQLYTKSLILVDQQAAREDRWKNLEKVWQLLGDKKKFHSYVVGEVRAYLSAHP